jgi:hypothetical protein
VLVAAADAISGARPGARRESLEIYIKRLEALEKIAAAFPGVEKSYAIQAGREIRIMVEHQRVDDARAHQLAAEIARRIEKEMGTRHPRHRDPRDAGGRLREMIARSTPAVPAVVTGAVHSGEQRVNLLFIADVVGSPGREVVRAVLPALRRRHAVDLVICNWRTGRRLRLRALRPTCSVAAPTPTGGNHLWTAGEPAVPRRAAPVRAANMLPGRPGRAGRCSKRPTALPSAS